MCRWMEQPVQSWEVNMGKGKKHKPPKAGASGEVRETSLEWRDRGDRLTGQEMVGCGPDT